MGHFGVAQLMLPVSGLLVITSKRILLIGQTENTRCFNHPNDRARI
jgi:hypothetical protein